MTKNLGMTFEHIVRRFLGDKAYGVAGYEQNDTSFRETLRNITPVLRKRVNLLDTTILHKEHLLNEIEEIHDLLKIRSGDTDKEIITRLFSLVSFLFGFSGIDGHIGNLPFYHQTSDQYFISKNSNGKDWFDVTREHERNIYTLRKETYNTLKKKGLSDQIIAGVLNTSEHQIKKLKHNI